MTYIVGSHWFICDVCGQKYRSTEKKKRWDGLIVCPADNEADHPQKYIRVEPDGQAVPDPRPRPEDVFALPVYCTPVTRTAAADDGTADCMTVDYRLNINYADYGGYQPIIVSDPAPILLDTFTAADGTDPTARDMDVHLSGQPRWVLSDVVYTVGQILSNKLVGDSPSGGYWGGSSLVYSLPGGEPIAGSTYPFAVVMRGCRSFSNGVRAYFTTTAATYDTIDLDWGIDTVTAILTDNDTPYNEAEVTYSLVQGNGESHNIALWANGSALHIIVDGASVANVSYSIGDILPNKLILDVTGNNTPDTEPPDCIDSFAYYEGLTLAQAIALTT